MMRRADSPAGSGEVMEKTFDKHVCEICGCGACNVFFELESMPVHVGLQWASREEAIACPRGDIRLAVCRECGFIWNVAFDPGLLAYSDAYDNSLEHSRVFHDYSKSVAQDLIARHNLRDKDIVDIGCGRGAFLRLICALGQNRGLGFDPSHAGEGTDEDKLSGVRFISDFYSEKYADYPADLVCCRFVLEHVDDPVVFLKGVRSAMGWDLDTTLYCEVPNALATLRDHLAWDVIYEHRSYFSKESLGSLFRRCGLDPCDIGERFDGQYLAVEAKPVDRRKQTWPAENLAAGDVVTHAEVFGEGFDEAVDTWEAELERMREEGARVVVWGAGSKAVTFLNVLKGGACIEYVVDVNPRKQGKHLAGSGQRIVEPDFLTEYRPDAVIVMNPIYFEEIRATMEGLGVEATALCAHGNGVRN